VDHSELPEDYKMSTRDIYPTVSGLGLVLDLTRQGLIEYSDKDRFSDTIKKGKARIESYLEQRLYGPTVAGVIFNLKNNYKWTDKHELEHSGAFNVNIPVEDKATL